VAEAIVRAHTRSTHNHVTFQSSTLIIIIRLSEITGIGKLALLSHKIIRCKIVKLLSQKDLIQCNPNQMRIRAARGTREAQKPIELTSATRNECDALIIQAAGYFREPRRSETSREMDRNCFSREVDNDPDAELEMLRGSIFTSLAQNGGRRFDQRMRKVFRNAFRKTPFRAKFLIAID